MFDQMSSLQKPRVAILKLRDCYTNWVGIILEALIFGSRHEPTESINGTSKRWVLNHSGSFFFATVHCRERSPQKVVLVSEILPKIPEKFKLRDFSSFGEM